MTPSPNLCPHCGATERFAKEIPAADAHGPDALPVGFFNKRADAADAGMALEIRTAGTVPNLPPSRAFATAGTPGPPALRGSPSCTPLAPGTCSGHHVSAGLAALCAGTNGGPAKATGKPPVPSNGGGATPAIPAPASPALAEIVKDAPAAKLASFPMFRIEVCAGCGHVEWFVPGRFLNPIKTRFVRTS